MKKILQTSSNYVTDAAEVCCMNYGSHIGEYIRQKLNEKGIKQAWVAEQLNMSRQNFPRNYLEKPELKPSEVQKLAEHLGHDFFDEYYKQNPQIKRYVDIREEEEKSKHRLSEKRAQYLNAKRGYNIHIEIDPENFDPEHAEVLGSSLRMALEDFRKKLEQSESGRNQDEI